MIDRRTFLAGLLSTPFAVGQTPLPSRGEFSWDVRSFGARGDGETNDTPAIQRAIDAASGAGGGRVVLPGGKTYLSGSVTLRSNITLELADGAVLKTSGNREDFREIGALLFARDAENVCVRGAGRIDGNFHAYLTELGEGGYKVTAPFLGPYDPLYPAAEQHALDGRPRIVLFVGCRNVRLERFTIADAPTWTVHPIGCQNLTIDGLSILNDLRVPNCDGIDVDHCRRVRIANCNIQAGDDCIVLKTSRNFTQYGPCEDIAVTGCTLTSSSAGIKIEPEGPETVRNAVFSACVISNSNRGIALLNRDGALVENLAFSDFVINTALRHSMWWGVGEPVHVSNLPRDPGTKAGTVRALRFSHFLCDGESGLFLHGWKESPLDDIAFEDVRVHIAKTSRWPGGFYDLRPGTAYRGLYQHTIAGIYARWVNGLRLRDVSVSWAPDAPAYYGPAIETEDVTGLDLENFKGAEAHPVNGKG